MPSEIRSATTTAPSSPRRDNPLEHVHPAYFPFVEAASVGGLFDIKASVQRRLLARNGHAEVSWRCPLLGEQRKTFARIELFRFGPRTDIEPDRLPRPNTNPSRRDGSFPNSAPGPRRA